jgi:hypothetical protein
MKKAQEVRNVVGKSKMTVMVLQLEGNDETIQQGFKALETALQGLAPRSVTLLAPQKQNQTDTLTTNAETLEVNQEAQSPVEFDESNAIENTKSEKNKKRRAVRTPSIVAMDIKTAPSIEDFYKKHGSPDTDKGRALLILAWLKEHRNIQEATADHIFTVLKLVNWHIPPDVGQSIRKLKEDRLVESGEKPGSFKINHVGVERILKAGKVGSA